MGGRREIVSVVGLAIVMFVVGCDRSQGSTKKKLAVVVSGDTAGWLMPCGCTSNQSGGLLRRATYLADARKGEDVIYLDAGGAPGGVSPYHREKFEAILAGERMMSVAAHNLGKAELALGAEALRDLARRSNVPFISANATDADGKAIAPASIDVNAGGRRMVVVGVLSPRFASAGIKISEPRQAVLAALGNGAKKDGRTVIVLAYLPEDELNALAASLPEADAVIGGPTGQAVSPRAVGPVVVGAATNKGKFLVRLDVPAAAGTWGGSVVELGPTFADAADQRQNVTTYLDRLAKRDFSAAESGLVDVLAAGTPADYRVAGSASCAACHEADQKVWNASQHSHAFETIKSKGFHVDPYCQSCHTTGYGLPGGFERLSVSTLQLGVGCESCHGPSAAHVRDPKRRTTWAAADQCVRCHDHENSPTFAYAEYWARVAHGRNAGK
ncbi:MAG: cycA1 [Phycisphaerales bacterium]|nr:cycA1 [Phycisphaerales bacterium]